MSTEGLSPVPDDLEFGQTIRGFAPGQLVLGRYTLQHIVGRGGMGLVWLAHDEHLQEDVALKFLPELVRLDAISLEELKRETRRSRKLAHPNIVKVYDFASDAISAAISMEFVPGATLSGLRAQQQHLCFEAEGIRDWMGQLLNALSYAHEDAKIVHRDLKPANIMVDEAGKVKVTDFGISSSISESVSRVTVQRGTSGTLSYMSPQQAQGRAPTVGDDIYSLGATIYELLAGKPPFYRGEIYQQLLHGIPDSMMARREQLGIVGETIPDEWEQTIAACLVKDPSGRPQSIAEVGERLDLGVRIYTKSSKSSATAPLGEIASMPPPSTQEVTVLLPESSKKSWAVPVAIVFVLIAVGAGLGWYFGIEQPAKQEKARQAQIAQQEAAASAEKARLQAEAKKAADAAAAQAVADQKAKDDATAKAAADAAAAQAVADQKAKDDAAAKAAADAAVAQAQADQKAKDDAAAKAVADAAAAKALADQKAKDDAAAKAVADAATAKALADQKAKDDAAKAAAAAKLAQMAITFKVSKKTYSEKDDLERAVANEFGANYRIADWSDVVAYCKQVSTAQFIKELDIQPGDTRSPMVTFNGQHFFGGNRHYFISRWDHQMPNGILAHEQIDNNYLTLGSFFGLNSHILCVSRSATNK